MPGHGLLLLRVVYPPLPDCVLLLLLGGVYQYGLL